MPQLIHIHHPPRPVFHRGTPGYRVPANGARSSLPDITPMSHPGPSVAVTSGDDKILSLADLAPRRDAARSRGQRVVQCHGCFDIVHPGHVRHLRQAKAMGDLLLVTITGDALISKGSGRPLIPQELRAENLAALDFVDWVVIDEHATASELLEVTRPDLYVKGREYETNNDPRFQAERQTVERHGGAVVFSSGDVVFSSTALIAAMEQSVDPFHKRLSQLTREPELEVPALNQIVASFAGKRVLVVGETIIDTYVICDRPEVAGESPIMTLRPVERRQYDGGAAVIARHLAALGARPVLVTALPETDEGTALRQRLIAQGVEVRSIISPSNLPEKQRFLVGSQKVMKIDLVDTVPLDAAHQERLLALAEETARAGGSTSHAAIIADFGLGLLTPTLVSKLCRTLRKHVNILAGDVSGRRSSLRAMRGMDLLCPSESELRDAMRLYGEGLPLVAWNLMQETKTRSTIVTMGADGLIGFARLPEPAAGSDSWQSRLKGEHVPALCPLALDPLGCGDALLSTATLALACGSSLVQASFLGACAAGIEVERLGNIPVAAIDLRRMFARVHGAHLTYAAPEVIASRGSLLRAS